MGLESLKTHTFFLFFFFWGGGVVGVGIQIHSISGGGGVAARVFFG